MGILKVGVVGFCSPTKFDEVKARKLIIQSYDIIQNRFSNYDIHIISGYTNVGVLKIAYEEAVKRNWKTFGVACKKAKNFPKFPNLDSYQIIGENWGDESNYFIDMLNVLIKIGGGSQSIKEVEMAKKKKIFVIEQELVALK